MIGTATIRSVETEFTKNLKKELRDQGHYLTGALESSIRTKTTDNTGAVVGEVTALDYIDDLETGIAASHIDPNDVSYIREMAEYAKKRFGLTSERQALKAGVAIARKHAREGMPTRNSYNFSSTGERTEAIQTSYDEHADQYDDLIENGLNRELDTYIEKQFKETLF